MQSMLVHNASMKVGAPGGGEGEGGRARAPGGKGAKGGVRVGARGGAGRAAVDGEWARGLGSGRPPNPSPSAQPPSLPPAPLPSNPAYPPTPPPPRPLQELEAQRQAILAAHKGAAHSASASEELQEQLDALLRRVTSTMIMHTAHTALQLDPEQFVSHHPQGPPPRAGRVEGREGGELRAPARGDLRERAVGAAAASARSRRRRCWAAHSNQAKSYACSPPRLSVAPRASRPPPSSAPSHPPRGAGVVLCGVPPLHHKPQHPRGAPAPHAAAHRRHMNACCLMLDGRNPMCLPHAHVRRRPITTPQARERTASPQRRAQRPSQRPPWPAAGHGWCALRPNTALRTCSAMAALNGRPRGCVHTLLHTAGTPQRARPLPSSPHATVRLVAPDACMLHAGTLPRLRPCRPRAPPPLAAAPGARC